MLSKGSQHYTGSDETLGINFFELTLHFRLKVKPLRLNPPKNTGSVEAKLGALFIPGREDSWRTCPREQRLRCYSKGDPSLPHGPFSWLHQCGWSLRRSEAASAHARDPAQSKPAQWKAGWQRLWDQLPEFQFWHASCVGHTLSLWPLVSFYIKWG